MASVFSSDAPITAALLRWWSGLENDRGARAELRRCRTLLQVVQTPAFHAARQRLVDAGMTQEHSRHPRLAAVVALLAHLRGQDDRSPAEAFSEGDTPVVSPLRFRQVLDARDDDELFARLRRVLPLVDSRMHPVRLANDVFHWGDGVRKRWVYAYRWPQKQPA